MGDIDAKVFRDQTPDPPDPFRAEKLLKEDFLGDYELLSDALWTHLKELNLVLFLLEKIHAFPFSLFTPRMEDFGFWRTVQASLVVTSITIAWRAIFDEDSKAISVVGLSKRMMRNAIDSAAESALEAHIDLASFKDTTSELEGKLNRIRHRNVAYLGFKEERANQMVRNTPPGERGDQQRDTDMTLDEMHLLVESAVKLLRILSFGGGHDLWFDNYPGKRMAHDDTDVERLLLHVADSSELLHLPEQRRLEWEHRRQSLTVDDMKLLNTYRAKLGLPGVT